MKPSVFAVAVFWLLAHSSPSAANLEIDCLDVGQGDCTLITSPSGQTMLVDGGDEGLGTSTVLPYLRQKGISHLDCMVATHYHQDHIGGLDEVINGGVSPTIAYDRGYSYSTQAYVNYVQAVGSVRTTINLGQVLDLGGGARARCVAVNGNGVPGASEENDLCAGLVVSYGGFDFYVGGDLSGYDGGGYVDVETPVASVVGDIEVVRINHHGSRYSSNPTFLQTTRPAASIISLGQNGYGFPTQEVIDRVVAVGSYLYQTELGSGGTIPPGRGEVANGDVDIVTDGSHYTINGDPYTIDGYVADTIPPVISNIQVRDITGTSATVCWTTNEPADSRVEYGLTSSYGSIVQDPSFVTDHCLTLTGLTPGSLYHFKVRSADTDGNQAASPDQTFDTPHTYSYSTRQVRISKGTLYSGSYLNLAGDDEDYMVIRSAALDVGGTDWFGGTVISQPPSQVTRLWVTYDGAYSMPRTQKLYLYDFVRPGWVLFDSRTVGSSDVSVTYSPPNAGNFVASNGRIGMRAQAIGSGTFYCHADYLHFEIETQ